MVFSLTHIHLQSIFDWNVKQLFLYLSAEYSTKNNVSMKKSWSYYPFCTATIFNILKFCWKELRHQCFLLAWTVFTSLYGYYFLDSLTAGLEVQKLMKLAMCLANREKCNTCLAVHLEWWTVAYSPVCAVCLTFP